MGGIGKDDTAASTLMNNKKWPALVFISNHLVPGSSSWNTGLVPELIATKNYFSYWLICWLLLQLKD